MNSRRYLRGDPDTLLSVRFPPAGPVPFTEHLDVAAVIDAVDASETTVSPLLVLGAHTVWFAYATPKKMYSVISYGLSPDACKAPAPDVVFVHDMVDAPGMGHDPASMMRLVACVHENNPTCTIVYDEDTVAKFFSTFRFNTSVFVSPIPSMPVKNGGVRDDVRYTTTETPGSDKQARTRFLCARYGTVAVFVVMSPDSVSKRLDLAHFGLTSSSMFRSTGYITK